LKQKSELQESRDYCTNIAGKLKMKQRFVKRASLQNIYHSNDLSHYHNTMRVGLLL